MIAVLRLRLLICMLIPLAAGTVFAHQDPKPEERQNPPLTEEEKEILKHREILENLELLKDFDKFQYFDYFAIEGTTDTSKEPKKPAAKKQTKKEDKKGK